MAKAQRYKSLNTVASWYFWFGVLTLIGGLSVTGYLIYRGFEATESQNIATYFTMALGAFIVSIATGVTQIATGEAIELAMDVEEHLRDSCELQRETVHLLRNDARKLETSAHPGGGTSKQVPAVSRLKAMA